MNNKSVFILIILIILGCCIVGLILVYLNPNLISRDNNYKTGHANQLSNNYDNNLHEDSCGRKTYPCFIYSEIKQTSSESFTYPEVEQIRLEPCPRPKPVCPVCRGEIKQVRGDGYMEKVEQTRIEC